MSAERRFCYHDSPAGRLRLRAAEDGALLEIAFPNGRRIARREDDWIEDEAPFGEARRQLDAYFARELREFDLRLGLRGTPFQLEVWNALLAVPYGETRSYSQIAGAIGRPDAVRAVGTANGANPLPIVVPCHRIVGQDGDLTGFGGGLDVKKRLLELEGALSAQLF